MCEKKVFWKRRGWTMFSRCAIVGVLSHNWQLSAFFRAETVCAQVSHSLWHFTRKAGNLNERGESGKDRSLPLSERDRQKPSFLEATTRLSCPNEIPWCGTFLLSVLVAKTSVCASPFPKICFYHLFLPLSNSWFLFISLTFNGSLSTHEESCGKGSYSTCSDIHIVKNLSNNHMKLVSAVVVVDWQRLPNSSLSSWVFCLFCLSVSPLHRPFLLIVRGRKKSHKTGTIATSMSLFLTP